MADAAILNFSKALKITNGSANFHQIWSESRSHDALQASVSLESNICTKTIMADAAIFDFEKVPYFWNRLCNCHQIWYGNSQHNVLPTSMRQHFQRFWKKTIWRTPPSWISWKRSKSQTLRPFFTEFDLKVDRMDHCKPVFWTEKTFAQKTNLADAAIFDHIYQTCSV